MDDEDQFEPTGIDPVMEVLIAQLHRNGILSPADIANMQRRLVEGGKSDLAEGLAAIVVSDLIDDPAARRADLHVIDGGNEAP